MVYLIHGDDNLSSRNYYISQKDNNSISFDAENLNLVELSQTLIGSALFTESNKVFIDNLFSNKSKNQNEIIDLLSKKRSANIFIYSNKEVSLKSLSGIKDLEQKVFKIPQNMWEFLDRLRPSRKQNLFDFHKTLAANETEIVFSMLIRQFRLLLAISSNSKNNISEIHRLAPWQKSKLVHQSSFFTQNSINKIISKLYEIDKSIKTGSSSLTLKQNIDFLMLEI